MGFLDKLFGKGDADAPLTDEDAFIEAAKIISRNDIAIIARLSHLMDRYEEYLQEMTEGGRDYRGLTADAPKRTICLFLMIDTLIDRGFMMEFDWKEDQLEVMDGLTQIAKALGLRFEAEIDRDFLDEGEDPNNLEPERVFTLVALSIDRRRYHIVEVEIDSDSYVMCLIPHKQFERCREVLAGLGVKLRTY